MGSTRLSRLSRLASALAVVCLASTCGQEDPPGCRVAQDRELASTALTKLPDARLERVGGSFVLIGTEANGNTIRFAPLSPDGVLGAETTVSVPPHQVGPWAAMTGKAAPGDQIAVVYGAPSASAPG